MEIKCRVWDKKQKRMIYSGTDDFYSLGFYKGNNIFGCHNVGGDPDSEIAKFDLMLSSGVSVKNSQEVYLSDLLQDKAGQIFKVIWTHGCFGIQNILNSIDTHCFHQIDFREVEFTCIGDIYQNPEILKK